MTEVLLTVAECAARLGVSQDFIRDRINTHKLRAIQALGRGYRIRPEWLDAFVTSLEKARGAPTSPSPPTPPSPRRKRAVTGAANDPGGPVFRSAAEARQGLRDVDKEGGR